MTRTRDLTVVAAYVLWWSPTIVVALIRAAPHFVVVRGRLCQVRLIGRGRADEAEWVIAALRREDDAADRWRARLRL